MSKSLVLRLISIKWPYLFLCFLNLPSHQTSKITVQWRTSRKRLLFIFGMENLAWMHFQKYELQIFCRANISEKSQTSWNSQILSVFKYKTKFQKAWKGKSALLFYIQRRGFQYRYCFDLFQHVLFIPTQAIQKHKIKIKTFAINYCVLHFSKIGIKSSHPYFQLVGGYNSFHVRHIQNIPQVLNQHHS